MADHPFFKKYGPPQDHSSRPMQHGRNTPSTLESAPEHEKKPSEEYLMSGAVQTHSALKRSVKAHEDNVYDTDRKSKNSSAVCSSETLSWALSVVAVILLGLMVFVLFETKPEEPSRRHIAAASSFCAQPHRHLLEEGLQVTSSLEASVANITHLDNYNRSDTQNHMRKPSIKVDVSSLMSDLRRRIQGAKSVSDTAWNLVVVAVPNFISSVDHTIDYVDDLKLLVDSSSRMLFQTFDKHEDILNAARRLRDIVLSEIGAHENAAAAFGAKLDHEVERNQRRLSRIETYKSVVEGVATIEERASESLSHWKTTEPLVKDLQAHSGFLRQLGQIKADYEKQALASKFEDIAGTLSEVEVVFGVR
ncbi:uncharacterized protein KY384_002852 [Bacidia gigantensis]|uniref:uncharacterized protein n=1 Tax=Bacidia gigantensis TaxID=2732470 RepID=UPI001D0524A2|nr:uncharacterized protein KY384_002852 [Bacidia gigantensis]KAG8532367.1 hypothetical protein KY384_002852 [Bacidia gigantensis]